MYAIACVDTNMALGYNGQLLVKSKTDMKKFITITQDNDIIVGRKTFDSMHIKNARGRTFHILTNDESLLKKTDNPAFRYYNSPNAILEAFKDNLKIVGSPPIVIGGESIYKKFLTQIDTVILTIANYEAPRANVYFPLDVMIEPFWKSLILDKWIEEATVLGEDTPREIAFCQVLFTRSNLKNLL